MLVNTYMKFHEGTLNGFWVTERTWPYNKIYYFQFQRAITPNIHNPVLRFLRSARHLMLLYICIKFHENISNGFWVTERTWFCDRQTDGQTDRQMDRRKDDQGKNNMSPNPLTGGRHNHFFPQSQWCICASLVKFHLLIHELVGWLCWGLTSQSTIFQSCQDGAIASWVINQYFRGVKCLAQGHNTAEVGLEPRTSRSGVRHSTTEPPRSPDSWDRVHTRLIFRVFIM